MTLFFDTALLPHGWAKAVRIEIADGRIASLDTGAQAGAQDDRHAIGLAGLPNVHSHGFQRGMAGLAEVRGPAGDNFWTWREVMYRFLDRLTPEQIEAITAQAYVEMLERGFTRVGEFHYLHHGPQGNPYANLAELAERIVAAAQEARMGLTLLPVFYAHSNFGGAPPTLGQRRFINTVDRFATLVELSRAAVSALPDANVGIAPHSLRAVTPEELAAILPLAKDGPVHIHAAEQTKEVEDCMAWSGSRPVAWLLDRANIDSRWCLVHATHVTAAETAGLARSGAVAGLCPVTEANLGDGIFPASDYLSLSGRVGIGTDSNVLIDAAGEIRGLEYAQRLTLQARNVLAESPGHSTGRRLFEAVLKGGARALGQTVCGLAEGAAADILSLDMNDAVFCERQGDTLLDSWIFAGGKIDRVWRAGREVVVHGRHIARNEIGARYRRALKSVLE